MKIITFILFLIVPSIILSNEVDIIDLHETKTLDQIVLDGLEEKNNDLEDENINNTIEESPESSTENDNDEATVVETDTIGLKNNLLNELDINYIINILENSKNIHSNIIKNEFNDFLLNYNLDDNDKNSRDIYFNVVNYFYSIGEIAKAYKLIQTIDIKEDENLNFYNLVKINYLLSTYQLENICNLKDDLSYELNFKNQIIDKIEIFCLILENKLSEAELLNSIMQETETDIDENYQQLFSLLLKKEQDNNNTTLILDKNININLIFLYSAMARIAELPLNETFLNVDPVNLAIPIILNKSSPIELRIKAANKSFNKNYISTDSLAALYQSVDFDSDQLNNPEKTILSLKNNIDILMSFYFQLINIQIFPSERLEALINFWKFSQTNDLESIAYPLSYKILDSIEISSEYVGYSAEISLVYLYNNNYEKAENWIDFYETVNGVDEKSSFVRILLELYSSDDINSILSIINSNFDKFSDSQNKLNEELVFILSQILQNTSDQNLKLDFENIYDNRLMPSIFMIENLKKSIQNDNDYLFLIYTSLSLNNKKWIDLHPNYLNLILSGFSNYKDGTFLKNIIIEIFEDYKIL